MQTIIVEHPNKMRTKETYADSLNQVEENDSTTHVDGVKRLCVLNDIHFYHMLENSSVDLMHDFNEGVAPFFVKFFIQTMINAGIKLVHIESKIRDFNYGSLEIKNKPSLINMKSHNLNQNASQIVCLLRNLPFVFIDQKDKLGDVWTMMIDLLRIMQILFSVSIPEYYLVQLGELIEKHLGDLKSHGLSLLFKHHILIHYPNVIRRIGPVIHSWMMRYEAKHKVFTTRAHTTNNFINIAKTLAYSHQEKMCLVDHFECDFIPSKKNKNINKCCDYEKYINHFHDRRTDDIFVLDFLHYNSYEYRQGLIIISNQNVFVINLVLHDIGKNEFLLLCNQIEINGFEDSLNSFKISVINPCNSCMIGIKSLKIKETFNTRIANQQMYLFARDLNFHNLQ